MALRRVYACQRIFVRNLLTQRKLTRTTAIANQIIEKRPHSTISAVVGSCNVQDDWNQTISDAERIVGYPTALQNLRWILNDDIANMAVYLRKVIDGNHPLLQTAK